MAKNVIGSIPKFDGEEEESSPKPEDQEEPKATEQGSVEASEEEAPKEEQETETPSTPPVEEKASESEETPQADTTTDLRQTLLEEVEGLKSARQELLLELKDLRGQRREAKQAEVAAVQEQIDNLEDVNKDDVALMERVVKARGFVSKQDVQRMFYDARKQEVFDKFFREFPEYSQENDPERDKFNPLLRELQLYKEPTNPADYENLLRRAHASVSGTRQGRERDPQVVKQQIKNAGVGAGGAQRSSSIRSFDPARRAQLSSWGWTDEQIDGMERRMQSQSE